MPSGIKYRCLYLYNCSLRINIDVYNSVLIRAPVRARAFSQQCLHERNAGRLSEIWLGDCWYWNTVLPLVVAKIHSGDSYEKTDLNFANLVLLLSHTWRCCALRTVSTLNDKLGKYHGIIGTVPFLSCSVTTEAIFSIGSVIPKIALCFMLPWEPWEWGPGVVFGMILRKSWYRAMLHTPIFLMSAPNIFHG